MTSIVAIASQKGGVGKTTTAVNLAAGLAQAGRRVLLIDTDPQANATSGLGQAAPAGVGLADVVLGNRDVREGVVNDVIDGLDLLPSGGPMRRMEQHLRRAGRSAGRFFERVLAGVRDSYSHVLIDCPPSLGALTSSALAAADDVLIPVQCEYYAMEGLAQVVSLLQRLADSGQRATGVFGVLMTMFDVRLQLAREVEVEVRGYFKDQVFTTVIPRDVALSEAPGHGEAIFDYNIRSCGAWAYLQLTREVISRVG